MQLERQAQLHWDLTGEGNAGQGQFLHQFAWSIKGNVVAVVVPAIAAEAIAAVFIKIAFLTNLSRVKSDFSKSFQFVLHELIRVQMHMFGHILKTSNMILFFHHLQ